MTKIYLLPYTFKTYLSTDKIHSGIDMSIMQTANALKKRGHDIRLFYVGGNLPKCYNGFAYNNSIDSDLKEYVKRNRRDIYRVLIDDIKKFSPDVIFSCHELSKFYQDLNNFLSIPIIYQTQSIPGFFADLNYANSLYDLSNNGLTIACVSEYHKNKFEAYYKKHRTGWKFNKIDVDAIIPSSYCSESITAIESDGVVRHVSALNPQKKTFAIHHFLEGTGIDSEVFTTSSYLSSDKSIVEYAKTNLYKYGDKTILNADRNVIMSSIAKAACTFVGLASYDTYTITSLESLSHGVPLIVWGTKDRIHPALEMCDDVMKEKYIAVIKNKQEFLSAVEKFKTYSLKDRQELADRTYEMNSIDKFTKNLENVFQSAIEKSKAKQRLSSTLDSFICS